MDESRDMENATGVSDRTARQSNAARRRMLGVSGEPLLYADWLRAVFIHFEVNAEILQREVPFDLDLCEGRAYLSLVAFTMRGMHPRLGGRMGALLFKPIATHNFLNVRAYVKHRGEPGIHFLAEWMDNPLSVRLGPLLFGLPYQLGKLQYVHRHEAGLLHGMVSGGDARLEYAAEIDPTADFQSCSAGSLDEFLLERYTAFTAKKSNQYDFFRIWHPPWPQVPVEISLRDVSLLEERWSWFHYARLIGANYSPGVKRVWMGRPQRLRQAGCRL